ncbi:Nucleotidyltransferase [Gracilaria domingensis]|nr:Nucleotidyltransferase [Gracilaria domingensis]
MNANKFRLKNLTDDGPIVFPQPTTAPPPVFPRDFKPDSDLLVDPYGNFYCFVCQVNVPKGSSNITQHLEGKKHEHHNRRFVSKQDKDAVRRRYQQAAFEQRNMSFKSLQTAHETPSERFVPSTNPYDTHVQYASDSTSGPPDLQPTHASAQSNRLSAPNVATQLARTTISHPQSQPTTPAHASRQSASMLASNSTSHPSTPHVRSAEEKEKRRKRKAEAKRLHAMSIDKTSYIATILAGDDEQVQSDGDADEPSSLTVQQRAKPFGPLNFKPPPGPDYFFESMPEESSPSEAAAKIKSTLSEAKKTKTEEKNESTTEERGVVELNRANDAPSFLSLATPAPAQGTEPVADLEKLKESLIILKDENGEDLPPWLLDASNTEQVLFASDSSIALHHEVLEFLRFIEPTDAEKASRENMVTKVKSIVKSLWPDSHAELFGSYATNIFLPSSDIDMCVTNTPNGGEKAEFEQLAQAIRNVTGFARRVNIVDAKVKLVKIIASEGSINCDITIGVRNGPDYVPSIKKYVSTYPALRPLLLVLKCFLQQRNLNEVYSGGLGSYSVLLLVVSHLQMLRYNFPSSKANLGALLQQFFQVYGKSYNLCWAGIQVKDNGCYFDKFERFRIPPHEALRFSIQDPNDETNHLGVNGFSALRIRKAFARASNALVKWRRDDGSSSPTPLGAVLNVDDVFLIRRQSVLEDLQKKGRTPLLDSLSPIMRMSTRRAPSPERRRERDPRLAKRQRTMATEQGRSIRRGVYNGNGSEPVQGRQQMQPTANTMYIANSNMYNPSMGYTNPTGGYSMTAQQYSAATPGFQYVNPGMVSGVMPPQVYNSGLNSAIAPGMNTGMMQVPVPQMADTPQVGRNDGYMQSDRYSRQDSYGQHEGYTPRNYYRGGRRRGRPYPYRRGGRGVSSYHRY